jgi:hypothetical protein
MIVLDWPSVLMVRLDVLDWPSKGSDIWDLQSTHSLLKEKPTALY